MPNPDLLSLLAQTSSDPAIDPELANTTIELLTEQIKALGEANKALRDSFVAFATIVSAAGVFSMFAVFDAVRKAREDAQTEVKKAVNNELKTAIELAIETLPQKIETSVDTHIKDATRYLKNLVEPESQLQKTRVAYWIPGETKPDNIQNFKEYDLIADRKFRINPLIAQPENTSDSDQTILKQADIVIVDLINYDPASVEKIAWTKTTESDPSSATPDEAKPKIVELLEWLCRYYRKISEHPDFNIALVIYAPPATRELNPFMSASARGSKAGTPYYTPANNLVSLLANTIDAANVVYALSSTRH